GGKEISLDRVDLPKIVDVDLINCQHLRVERQQNGSLVMRAFRTSVADRKVAPRLELCVPSLDRLRQALERSVINFGTVPSFPSTNGDEAEEACDLESRVQVFLRLGDLQQMRDRRIGGAVTSLLMTEAIPEQRFRCLIVPRVCERGEQLW